MYCTECIVSKFQRKILKIKCKLRSNRNKFQTILIRFMHTIRILPYTFIRSLHIIEVNQLCTGHPTTGFNLSMFISKASKRQ